MIENTTKVASFNYADFNPRYIQIPQNKVEVVRDSTELSSKDSAKKNKKLDKKSVIAIISLAAASLVTLGGVLTKARGLNKKVKEIIVKKLKINNKEHVLNLTKFKGALNLSSKEGKLLKITNVLNNSANIKDCYLLPFLNKFPILRGFARKTSDIYTKTGVNMTQSAYKHARNSYAGFDKKILELIKEIGDEELSAKIAQRNAIIEKNFMPENILQRVGQIEDIMDNIGPRGIAVEVRDKFTSLIKKAIFDRDFSGFGEFVAEDMVKAQKANYIDNLRKSRDLILKSDDEIIDILRSSVDEKTLNNIINAKTNAQKSLNNAIRTEGNDLFDKIRDIKIGSAPNDILGMLSTTGMLGVYLAQAKDKDQRVEAALTTGVPLGLGMLSTTFATMKMYTGIKALAFGAIATFVANTIGKAINEEYKKRHNLNKQDVEIPTINNTFEDLKEKIKIAP